MGDDHSLDGDGLDGTDSVGSELGSLEEENVSKK